jgi:hypothetical protein
MPAAKREAGRPLSTDDGFKASVAGFGVWEDMAEALDYLARDSGLGKAYHQRAALLEYLVAKGLVLPREMPANKSAGPNAVKRG